MTKTENIFHLYSQLGNSGEKGKAGAFMSELTGTSVRTVKSSWIYNKELPEHVTDEQKDKIIGFLQSQIAIKEGISFHN